jgi:hypothetical protein
VNERGDHARGGAGDYGGEGREDGVHAGDQQRGRDGAAERIAALGGQVGEAEEAERDQYAEAEETEQKPLFEHVDDQRVELCHPR